MKTRCWPLLAGLLALGGATSSPGLPEIAVGTGLSIPSASGSGSSHGPVWSSDGQSVAFVSAARNLTAHGVQGRRFDVYVRQLNSRQTSLASVNPSGTDGGNDHSLCPSISSNGLIVAFESLASDLAGPDTNGVFDIYVRDLVHGTTRLASAAVDGSGSANGPSRSARLSEDGRFVVFESSASNLVTNDFNGTNDVFIHELRTGVTSLVSLNSEGTCSPNGPSSSAAISADGTIVAFVSRATNLVLGVTNQAGEVYVRRIAEGTTFWAGVDHLIGRRRSTPVNAADPVLSRDGRFLACKVSSNAIARWDLSRPTNTVLHLIPADGATPLTHALVFEDNPRHRTLTGPLARLPITLGDDGRYSTALVGSNRLQTSTIQRVDFEQFEMSVEPSGVTLGSWVTNQMPSASILVQGAGTTDWPDEGFQQMAVSRDGSRVAFVSDLNGWNTNIVKGAAQILIVEDSVALPWIVSTNRVAVPGRDLGSTMPSLSPDGRQIAYETLDPLVPDDLNNHSDVYRRDLNSGATELISERAPSQPSRVLHGASFALPNSLSADGRWLVFSSRDRQSPTYDSRVEHFVWVRDLVMGTNQLLHSPETSFSRDAVISRDGRQIAFVQGKGIPVQPSIVHLDRGTGVRTAHPATYVGFLSQGILPHTSRQNLSPDGRFLALQEAAPAANIVVKDLEQGTNITVNIDYLSRTIVGAAIGPVFSPDSRWLAFGFSQGLGTNRAPGLHLRSLHDGQVYGLAPGYVSTLPTNSFAFSADSRFIVFARDRQIIRRSLGPDPHEHVVTTHGDYPDINGDGRFVVCASPDENGIRQIWRFDLHDVQTNLVSRGTSGAHGGNAPSHTPVISADGRFVAFASAATNLVTNDTNGVSDVFVRDTLLGTTLLASVNASGTGSGNGPSMRPVIGADGRTLLFHSLASDLVDGDHNQSRDVYVLRLSAVDSDSDGLDDDWEQAHFSSLGRDGTGDFDRDGATDREEFLAGTAPTADTSVLRVMTLSSAGGPGTRILWSAVPGRTYRVEFKPALEGAAWQAVGDLIAATSTTGVATDWTASGLSRFYRVLLEQ